ncbi:MAG: HupE/UreJ family protein [Rhizobacter sp.]
MITAWIRCRSALVAALLALMGAAPAWAHKASDAYLLLAGTPSATTLRVDVALRDLDVALDLDADGDGRLTWAEVRAAWPAIEDYLRSRVQVDGCDFPVAVRSLERRVDGVYAALSRNGTCRADASHGIRYTVLGDVDATHRGIARIELDGAPGVLRVLDPARPDAVGVPAAKAALPSFLREGVRHILTGYDHVLFLLCLLLPSVMRRTPRGWQPVEHLGQAVWPVLGIVTAFTLAHSITLALAALKLASLPPSFIEPAIAATIVLAAFDNVRPIFNGPRALVTFAFGLIHGFGFAGVLAELNLPAADFAWALLRFNLGLEIGQVAIVAVVTTLLFLLRGRARYPAWVIRGGSLAAMLIGLVWLIERTADVSLLPL